MREIPLNYYYDCLRSKSDILVAEHKIGNSDDEFKHLILYETEDALILIHRNKEFDSYAVETKVYFVAKHETKALNIKPTMSRTSLLYEYTKQNLWQMAQLFNVNIDELAKPSNFLESNYV